MSVREIERTTLAEPVVNDMETMKHIQVGEPFPGKVGLCGAVNDRGVDRGPYRPGGTRRVCAECERIYIARYAASSPRGEER
jgi:hypothetical protein